MNKINANLEIVKKLIFKLYEMFYTTVSYQFVKRSQLPTNVLIYVKTTPNHLRSILTPTVLDPFLPKVIVALIRIIWIRDVPDRLDHLVFCSRCAKGRINGSWGANVGVDVNDRSFGQFGSKIFCELSGADKTEFFGTPAEKHQGATGSPRWILDLLTCN